MSNRSTLSDFPPFDANLSAAESPPDEQPNNTGPEGSAPLLGSQALNLYSPIDLRVLDYVNACDENLVCPICRCPYIDPVTLTDCGHCFCRDCIRQTWSSAANNAYHPASSRRDCPSCRTPAKNGLRSSTNKILTNILDDMMVKCPNSVDGCAAQIRRGEVQDHVSLYCGLTQIECTEASCQLLTSRKDCAKGCLHIGVCCVACHGELFVADLEVHQLSRCPDRAIECNLCHSATTFKDLEYHKDQLCSGVELSCPGKSLGCPYQGERALTDLHARRCPLATLNPIFAAQKKRLDEQEIAQKHMHRRVKILENGFATMRDLLYPPLITEESTSDGSRNVQAHLRSASLPHGPNSRSAFDGRSAGSNTYRPTASASSHLPADFDFDLNADRAFFFPTPDDPYASPLHHLLSVHENLREEVARVSNALQELEGRQSLQIINENLRTREEMSYLGAQLASLSRQVHWLTSTQLQQQQPTSRVTPNIVPSEGAATGPSVEAAVSAVNNAVRGAARMMGSGREGMGLRRGSSEEGRTKL